MFDVGFSELVVIAVVALVVVGPERLPRVARTVGALLGRAQRYVNEVKAEVEHEVDLVEFEKIKSTFYDAAKEVLQEVHGARESLQGGLAAVASAEPPAATLDAHGAGTQLSSPQG